MDNDNMKEVYFGQYCETCVHKSKAEEEKPCYDCLEIPARQYSHKPEHYEKGN